MGGVWGAVCQTNWNKHSSMVACKQLGYDGELQAHLDYQRKQSSSYLIDTVECTGTESSICSCQSASLGPSTSCGDEALRTIILTCACKYYHKMLHTQIV